MNTEQSKQKEDLLQQLLKQRDRLFAYIYTLVRHASDAEDLFQEVSLVIVRKADEGVIVKNFGSWSREIAHRTVLNYWKTREKGPSILSPEAMMAVEGAFQRRDDEGDTRKQEQLERLEQCVRRLPRHLHRLIRLFYGERLSLREIGKRLSRSAGAVQVALSRTRAQLLTCVEETEHGESAV